MPGQRDFVVEYKWIKPQAAKTEPRNMRDSFHFITYAAVIFIESSKESSKEWSFRYVELKYLVGKASHNYMEVRGRLFHAHHPKVNEHVLYLLSKKFL